MDILLIIVGIAIVLRGADNLTEGSVSIARRFNMSELIIGLTVVALGTSMPELCVSLTSALSGTADMALGNIIGSNIFNVFFIVGLCAVIHPMSVGLTAVRRDLPFCFAATLMLIFFLTNGTLSMVEGLVMLLIYAVYTVYTIRKEKTAGQAAAPVEPVETKRSLPKIFYNPYLKVTVGLIELVLGSNLFVDHATLLATDLGVSEAVIGITILGFGTSMPELATSLVAAIKGSTSIALGNVIGSCVLNILVILGLTSVITPLAPQGITALDLAMVFLSALLMWFFSFTKKTMERWEGSLLLIIFVAYFVFLIYNA
ncbi:MAG: calcium/sodium antiporter [Prevotella sp.]|nr:calcium/sodium antiporter [Prevotella sp.]